MDIRNPSNKYYSNRQEIVISKYLGWSKVSGSGSRNFFPGDIISSQWVGECKTHTTPKHKIIFNKKTWIKISNEAISKFKLPVLFVDDGSQKVDNTWCMFSMLPSNVHILKDYPLSIKQNISFYDVDLKQFHTDIIDPLIFKVIWDDITVYICTLKDFKKVYFRIM